MKYEKKKTLQNFVALFVLQIVSIVVGLIIIRLIIINYGSNVNGTIVSATKFLSYITLFEAGVGGVFKAALYKPLANKDNSLLSKILHEADSFLNEYRIFLLYT